MKCNKWTLALAGAGVVSLASAVQAEEAQMSQVLTAVSSTQLSGYVDTSAIWKFGTGNANLPGRQYDGPSKQDGFNLNVASLTLEKPLSEDQWASGYRVQLLFGPDAFAYEGFTGSIGGPDDLAIKQAYVALRIPAGTGIDLRAGVFDSIIGYESFESYLNPNYSRSFGHGLEPKQHTGLLATYKLSDAVSVSAGIANTYNSAINARPVRGAAAADESEKTYMASITVTAPDSWGYLKGSAWYAGVVDGLAGNGKDTTSVYIGGSLKTPVEGLSIGGAFDYRFNGNNTAKLATASASNWAYAIAGYASFQATEKWKLNARLDFTQGSDGTFFDSGAAGNVGLAADKNSLGSVTITADYALWANVISRAELRWDRNLGGDKPYGGTVPGVGVNENAVSLAANIIYKF